MTYADMKGKVAVVTGGAKGLGEGIVRRLLTEGVSVLAVDRDQPALEALRASEPSPALAVHCADVSVEAEADAYVRAAVERFGAIHYVVNNAGILGPHRRIDQTSMAEFDALFAINLRAVFLGMRAGLRQMLAQGSGGAIVNVASAGAIKASAGRALYSSSKRAVVGLTLAAALETAGQNIRVNVIAPGGIDTPMGQEVEAMRRALGHTNFANNAPMGRKAAPGEIAALVTWLLSDEASFVTGATYVADGGWTL